MTQRRRDFEEKATRFGVYKHSGYTTPHLFLLFHSLLLPSDIMMLQGRRQLIILALRVAYNLGKLWQLE